MKYGHFIVKRLLLSIVVLIGLSMLIFVIARVLPGDPVRMALGPHVEQWVVDQYRSQLNMDKPLYMQYILWLRDVVTQLDFGQSLVTRRAVSQDIAQFLPNTLELIFLAFLMETVFGVFIGTYCGYYSGKWFDNTMRVVSYLGVSTPSFVWAILMILVFCFVWPILPSFGQLSDGITITSVTGFKLFDSIITGNFVAVRDLLRHMLMPAIALSLGGFSQTTRITRSSIVETMEKDFVWAEHASGLPTRKIMFKYVLKGSMISPVSVIALDVAAMIGNAFLIEQVFNYPGLSKYALTAILNNDLNAIVAVVMIIGVCFVFANIVVDLIVSKLDPRIVLQKRG